MTETLVNRILFLAGSQPEKIALAFKQETLTYAELRDKMTAIAGRLADLGVKRGDRVPFSAVSKPESVALYLAIQYAGAAAVFVDKNCSPDNIAFIYNDCDASIFFTDKPVKGHEESIKTFSLKEIYEGSGSRNIDYISPEENDLAELIYTTGTTGQPKGCMLTYRSVHAIWMNTIDGIRIRNDDILLLPLPLNHSFALRVLRAYLYLGAEVVLQNGFTFAREIENNIDRYHCSAMAIVPASVETIARQMQDKFVEIMGRFRYIEVGAGSLTLEQRKRLTGQLPGTLIMNTWGSSESGGAIFLNVTEAVHDEQKISALGKPLPCVEIKTIDESGKAFVSDRDHPGRMALKGDMMMAGYWNKPELTGKTIVDGWLLTNDMIYIDPDGFVYMLGRADDIINVGGEKVSPLEVENAAGEYENIAECACIGVPDPEHILGWVPVLFAAARNNRYSEEDLKKYLAGKIEKYKIPVKYVTVTEIPRNSMQKIDRKALRKMWEQREGKADLMNETIRTIMTRRSIRKFSDFPVGKDIIQQILKAGYYAPSGNNMQTWRFTVITKASEISRLKEAAGIAAKANNVYFFGWENPQVLILVSNDQRNPNGCQDASCAAENIMLAAWSLGVGAVWLNPLRTLRDKEPVKQVLDSYGIPETHIVWSTIALGYPAADGVLLKKKANVVSWIE